MKQESIIPVEEYKANFKKNKNVKREERVQLAVCAFIKAKYPAAIFMCDLASGMNLGKNIGGMNTRLRSSRGLPDLFIAHPKNNFKGFFLEIKKDNTVVFLAKGGITTNKHILEQEAILKRLRNLGFYAQFGIGLENCIDQIDRYMSL